MSSLCLFLIVISCAHGWIQPSGSPITVPGDTAQALASGGPGVLFFLAPTYSLNIAHLVAMTYPISTPSDVTFIVATEITYNLQMAQPVLIPTSTPGQVLLYQPSSLSGWQLLGSELEMTFNWTLPKAVQLGWCNQLYDGVNDRLLFFCPYQGVVYNVTVYSLDLSAPSPKLHLEIEVLSPGLAEFYAFTLSPDASYVLASSGIAKDSWLAKYDTTTWKLLAKVQMPSTSIMRTGYGLPFFVPSFSADTGVYTLVKGHPQYPPLYVETYDFAAMQPASAAVNASFTLPPQFYYSCASPNTPSLILLRDGYILQLTLTASTAPPSLSFAAPSTYDDAYLVACDAGVAWTGVGDTSKIQAYVYG